MLIEAVWVGGMFGASVISYAAGKSNGRRNASSSHQENKTEELPNKGRKLDSSKHVLEIMKEFIQDRTLFEDFKLVKAKDGVKRYQYLENDYLFTFVQIEMEDSLYMQIKNKDKEILMCKFDTYHEEFQKNEIARSVIDVHSKASLEIVRHFLEVAFFGVNWRLPLSVELVDDIGEVQPIYTKEEAVRATQERQQLENVKGLHMNESVTHRMNKLKALVEKPNVNIAIDIWTLFQTITTMLTTCLERIEMLNPEQQYAVEEAIQRDVQALFEVYITLNENSQKEKQQEVKKALLHIETTAKHLVRYIEQKNIKEVERIVRIIHSRTY